MKWGHQRLTSNVSPLVRHRRWQGGRGGHHQPHPLAALHLHNSDIRCLRSQTNIKPWRSLGSSCPWRSRRPWPGAAMNKSRSRFPQSWSSSAPWYTSRAQPAELKSLGLVFLNPYQHQEDGTKPEKGGIFHFGWIKREELTPLSYVWGVLQVMACDAEKAMISASVHSTPPLTCSKKVLTKIDVRSDLFGIWIKVQPSIQRLCFENGASGASRRQKVRRPRLSATQLILHGSLLRL